MEVKKIVYDDYNSRVRADQSTMLTLTTNCGAAALRTAVKIIETKRCTQIPEKFHRFVYEIDGELYLIRIRKLTPRECWRLMGFSDEDFDKAASVVSSTQLYKQAGNSIVKQVLMAIFSQMIVQQDKKSMLKNKSLALLDLL